MHTILRKSAARLLARARSSFLGRLARSQKYIIPVSYGLSVVGLAGVVAVAYVLYLGEHESDDWVFHTAEVVAQIENLHLRIVEAESAGRGYIISEKPAFLTRFKALNPLIDDQIRHVRQATAANATQQKGLTELVQLVSRRLAFLEAHITARAGRAPSAASAALAERGHAEMQAINGLIDGMRSEERTLLQTRLAARRNAQNRVALALLCAGLLGTAILTVVFRYTSALWAAREAAENAATHLAHHDVLTGLPNRRLLQDRLELGIAQARRHGHKVGVLCLDLDGFKKVNDTNGHSAGDELLRKVAERLRQTVRSEDTVARLGGDEFVVVLMQVADIVDAAVAARKIIEMISKPFELDDVTVTVGTSIGIALCPDEGAEPDTLLRRADEALYRAKHAGKGRFDAAFDVHLLSEAIAA
jgi:diguanylate cyclase (GGDEF)-like protein